MLIGLPPSYRKSRRLIEPVCSLELVSGTYVWGASLTLVFNKAIDIAGLVFADFLVNDPLIQGAQYMGRADAALVGPNTVRMNLLYVQDCEGTATTLTVQGGNGIYSVSDAQRFAGVTDIVIASVSP